MKQAILNLLMPYMIDDVITPPMTATNDRISIPDQSRPGTTTAFHVGHQGGNNKRATGAKLRGREDITIATWNVRTLRAAGKMEELLHEMDRYKWSTLGLCEMRWKKSGETPTDGGHRMYFSGKEDKHEQGAGCLVHKDIQHYLHSGICTNI